jgi:hypothetical protein
MDQAVKIKITELEFDWDYPPGDPLPPDYETRNNLIGEVIELTEEVVQEIQKTPYERQEIIWDFLTDWIAEEFTLFPIEKLEWEEVQE